MSQQPTTAPIVPSTVAGPSKVATAGKPTQPGVNKVVDWNAFDERLAASSLGGKARSVDRVKLNDHMKNRVHGQDDAMDVIVRSVCNGYFKAKRSRPVASFFLLGPPGVGKTETAKALAEGIFGAESDLLTINCSELKSPGECMHKLIGTGTGYVGSEKGGMLTRPLMAKPEKVVCFDEIEKADRSILDIFLSALGDGTITEGSGRKVDCTRSIWVITSNLEHEKAAEVANTIEDHEARCAAFKSIIEPHSFRPEILDRIGDYLYFKPLPPRVMASVIAQKIVRLCGEYELVCAEIDVDAVFHLLEAVTKQQGGVRAMMLAAERRLGDSLVDAKGSGAKAVKVTVQDDKLLAIPA
jgi:ATP-dependent Clp protease ATP-binding subunit ClpA